MGADEAAIDLLGVNPAECASSLELRRASTD